jgi:Fe-S cluster biogenesis protein NfuA
MVTFKDTIAFENAVKEGVIMQDRVKAALDKVRPNLQADGGDVQFVEVKDGIVKVKLTGACAGCPMSQMTLKKGIESFLKREIPEVKEVVSA